MSDKKVRVPQIRFAGFTGDWEDRKLGDVYKFQYGQYNTNPSNGGQYPVYGANGIIGGYSDFNAEDSIIIGHMGEYAGIVLWGDGKHFVTYNGIITTPKDNKMVSRFGFYLLQQKNIRRICGGSGQPFLTYEMLDKLQSTFPVNIDEQSKINGFFTYIDNLITLQQRQLDKLAMVKKTMLEKMFPKDGANVPEIRFAGFTGAWEERKLGDISDIVGGGTPSSIIKEYWGGDIDWYAPAEIGRQIFVKESQKKITELGLQKSSAKILPIGTVLFTSRAGIGNTAILAKEGASNQGFQSIIPHKDRLDSYFIFTRTNELKHYGETVGAGSTFVEVSGKQMAKMPIKIPGLIEQKKIGKYFASVDNLLTLHQRELNTLKTLKKSMLQHLFI